MNQTYKNLVFTKHAWERLDDRSISQDIIYQVVNSPDKTFHNQQNYKFIRTINGRKIHVVATPVDQGKMLIISTWVRGEDDREPFIWLLITLPFKILWWCLKILFKTIFGDKKRF
ncbi:MAG: hypothetical protein COU63_00640 [Candidatus Pacebacteria bacterium CG10_big_fil_rev_8_21_14_0_10_36_11]|nr:DUF4258 domain-containing protein [Candidatus Pacearchaeota archaeon]OIP74535.1 MAG: hypothetical protein AUK08_00235 [Candidatus Pacebacteria bacterium CG2_30_36_39]PIR65161.1 MAG: hypothetical protein COU63_00640 [Candidatus Pacebacteria bacterium CG10_big_fil_rev_8_21_14_0_10_36_11]PJC42652.1 MAG: hypothetical protein CO040_03420 [Candidatus Pacebacteria bacterium CG_4_9_14_0_2_um_filter_36_8]